MSAPTFTPGPWQLVHPTRGAWTVRTKDGDLIAEMWIAPTSAAEPNARLIAAAPDGLRAAELAYRALLRLPFGSRERIYADIGNGALAALRDFIASATGQSAEAVQDKYESDARAALALVDA